MSCIFCKIVNQELGADIVYEDDDVIAFKDLYPTAPTHFLVIPKKHISTINDASAEDAQLLGKMMLTAANLAIQQGFAENGYRLVLNCNADGGQSVYHIHLHVLAGRQMGWPAG